MVAKEAATCTRCRLADTRTQVVFGVGNPDAELMFIGEAPGLHEDKQGEPFVGAAGQLLTRMLEGIGRTREEVYIANILKCRPPGNRDPLPDEIEACTPWLVETISVIQPALIVTLGNFATKYVLQTQTGITRMRGSVYDWHGRKVIPTFHPAAILHGGGEKSRQFGELEEDFALIERTLAPPEPSPSSPRSDPCSTSAATSSRLHRPTTSWSCSSRMERVARTTTADETRDLGAALAPVLAAHDVVVLTGELGAGKTTLVQGIARGLGATEHVASPTFTLVREYTSGRVPLAHVDLFRLEREQDVIDLALDELEDGERVLLVEWGDPVAELLADERLRIELTADPEDVRRIAVSTVGAAWDARSDAIGRALAPWSAP